MLAKGLDVGRRRLRREHHHQGHRPARRCPSAASSRSGSGVLEISQIGKVCHTKCAIYYQAGDCVMPREGIFAVVREAGRRARRRRGRGRLARRRHVRPHAARGDRRVRARAGRRGRRARREGRRAPRRPSDRAMAELKIGILTCSDTRTADEDTAGRALIELAESAAGRRRLRGRARRRADDRRHAHPTWPTSTAPTSSSPPAAPASARATSPPRLPSTCASPGARHPRGHPRRALPITGRAMLSRATAVSAAPRSSSISPAARRPCASRSASSPTSSSTRSR